MCKRTQLSVVAAHAIMTMDAPVTVAAPMMSEVIAAPASTTMAMPVTMAAPMMTEMVAAAAFTTMAAPVTMAAPMTTDVFEVPFGDNVRRAAHLWMARTSAGDKHEAVRWFEVDSLVFYQLI